MAASNWHEAMRKLPTVCHIGITEEVEQQKEKRKLFFYSSTECEECFSILLNFSQKAIRLKLASTWTKRVAYSVAAAAAAGKVHWEPMARRRHFD